LKPRQTILGLILFFGLSLSCSTDYGTVEVYLVRSPNTEEDPLDPARTTHIRIRVTGKGMAPQEGIFAFKEGGISTVPAIPIGNDRVITVEGLAGKDGYAISRGRSLPIRIQEGSQRVELFVATIGRFSYTPGNGLTQARFAHTTAISKKGELFVIGGAVTGSYETPLGQLDSIEIYHPGSGKTEYFTCGQTSGNLCLKDPRAHAAGVLVPDGVLLLGGVGENDLLDAIELLDLELKALEALKATAVPRQNAVVIHLGDQSLVAGGIDRDGGAVDVAELLNADYKIEILNLGRKRRAMAAQASSQKGFLFGGFDENDELSTEFLLFDPLTKQFSSHPIDVESRAFAGAVPLSNGQVLVIGGLNANGEGSTAISLFDPTLNRLCPLGDLKRGRWLHGAVKLPDGRVLVIGGLTGWDPGQPTPTVEILDPRFIKVGNSCGQITGVLSISPGPDLRIPRFAATASLLPNNVVAVVGGLDQNSNPINQIEVFVPDE